MASTIETLKEIVRRTLADFSRDDCPQMAAALAYYTLFSLPPLLVLVLFIAGAVAQPGAIEGRMASQMASVVGPEATRQIERLIAGANARLAGGGGVVPTLLGVAALAFGASGAFTQLQRALNRAWEVAPAPAGSRLARVRSVLLKRLLSFGMILGTGFLLLVSLGVSALLSMLGTEIERVLPGELPLHASHALDLGISLFVITLLVAAIFKVLPDARVAWRDVWVGAAATSVLFVLGKFAIGFYLGRSDLGEVFGAAGSLVMVLAWIYFSALLFLLGAEFTQVWARRYGKQIEPARGAVRVRRELVHAEGGSPSTR